jgi:glycerate kinase
MKIVIAPQGFKAGISGLEAAQAIARGVASAAPRAETVLAPVADGGDGTLHALVDATGGQVFASTVTGPLGQPLEALWGIMGDGRTAVIEMALASGLALVPQRRRNPRITTTAGTGEIIKEALERGFTRIIVGLGGSATNDGGAGFAAALGARFLDAAGRPLPPGGSALARLDRIEHSGLHPRLADATVIAATDVTNPLCGPDGASAIFGPQKGANPDMVRELDAALANYARVVARDVGSEVLDQPGAGAAGGLGAGLMAFAGATLQSGIDMVCEVLNFDEMLRDADLVITGEGRADRSTIFNKAPAGVARRAQAHGVPTLLLAGSLGPGYEELYDHSLAAVICIADRPMSFEQSLSRSAELLESAAKNATRLFLAGRGTSGRSGA